LLDITEILGLLCEYLPCPIPSAKMCFERLTKLKCGHFESYLFNKCKMRLGRACPEYKNAQVREDRGRSCAACKARLAANLGVATMAGANS
jgi:hypothetical protein